MQSDERPWAAERLRPAWRPGPFRVSPAGAGPAWTPRWSVANDHEDDHAARWRVKGHHWSLADVDPASTPGAPSDRAGLEALLPTLQGELFQLQNRLWAESRRSLLVVLQALDAGGKDGTIDHVFRGVNPQGTRVTSFKAPTGIEASHDFLWRVHQAVPGAGEIGIFNRSHYEDVLVVRVENLAPESVWRPRYDAINDFERHLTENGVTIVKLWLHISPEEQRQRFLERMERPEKRWKFRAEDLEVRRRWDDYQEAAQEMLTKTSTAWAPWYVVPADRKWYRNWVVSEILIDTLTAMDPHYPPSARLDDLIAQLEREAPGHP